MTPTPLSTVQHPDLLEQAGRRRAAAFREADGVFAQVVADVIRAGGIDAPGVNVAAIARAMNVARGTVYRAVRVAERRQAAEQDTQPMEAPSPRQEQGR